MLQPIYNCQQNIFEIGIDEAGRGPLFGRLYVAAVVLPKIDSIDTTNKTSWRDIKDSKKIKSPQKMEHCAEFIQQNALAYSIQFIENDRIDEINIRQAVFEGMHACIRDIMTKLSYENAHSKNLFLLIDGNDFKPFRMFDEPTQEIITIPYATIEGGDNKFLAIAASSILAKHARDTYIRELCQRHPELNDKYAIGKNMGYGTKLHLEGIQKYGITEWHKKTLNF